MPQDNDPNAHADPAHIVAWLTAADLDPDRVIEIKMTAEALDSPCPMMAVRQIALDGDGDRFAWDLDEQGRAELAIEQIWVPVPLLPKES